MTDNEKSNIGYLNQLFEKKKKWWGSKIDHEIKINNWLFQSELLAYRYK